MVRLWHSKLKQCCKAFQVSKHMHCLCMRRLLGAYQRAQSVSVTKFHAKVLLALSNLLLVITYSRTTLRNAADSCA